MSYGQPFISVRPTPGVTPSPTYESDLDRWALEAQTCLEAKVTDAGLDLSAVAEAKHGLRQFEAPAAGGAILGATYDAANGYVASAAAPDTVTIPLLVQVGQRIRAVSMHGRANGAAAWTLDVLRINKATGVVTNIGTVASAIAAAIEEKSIPALTEVCNDSLAYVARWTAGGAGSRVYGVTFQLDRV
jgi:hypothetical protein